MAKLKVEICGWSGPKKGGFICHLSALAPCSLGVLMSSRPAWNLTVKVLALGKDGAHSPLYLL